MRATPLFTGLSMKKQARVRLPLAGTRFGGIDGVRRPPLKETLSKMVGAGETRHREKGATCRTTTIGSIGY
jgi:hypothetical protein